MKQTDVPVLYIAFARPEYARKSFNAIKAAKPKKFYFYSNKGREGHGDELERNEQVRSMLKEVDWDCELHTWFRDECVDVYTSLWGAINWLFENEEMGIILEEDCVAAPSFFGFAEKMLLKYKDEPRIWMIAGDNYAEKWNPHGYSYHFSKNLFIYGWASWRDRWQKVDWNHSIMPDMINNGVLEAAYDTKQQRNFHTRKLTKAMPFVERTKCWDYMFTSVGMCFGGLSILPSRHLIQNVGLSGSHHKAGRFSLSATYNPITFLEDEYPITKEPPFIVSDVEFDEHQFHELHYKDSLFWRRAINKMIRVLKL